MRASAGGPASRAGVISDVGSAITERYAPRPAVDVAAARAGARHPAAGSVPGVGCVAPATMAPMPSAPAIPARIGDIEVPQRRRLGGRPGAGRARALPRYLLAHSVRSYCWGVADRRGRGLVVRSADPVDRRAHHDVGLTRLRAEHDVLRVRGRRDRPAALERRGMSADGGGAGCDRDHPPHAARGDARRRRRGRAPRPGDRDRRPRRRLRADRGGSRGRSCGPSRADAFDRRFLRAIEREVAIRGDCQSARLLGGSVLAEWMARLAVGTGPAR